MKKILALILSILMMLSFAACSSDSGDEEAEKKTSFAVGETADVDGAKYTVTDLSLIHI